MIVFGFGVPVLRIPVELRALYRKCSDSALLFLTHIEMRLIQHATLGAMSCHICTGSEDSAPAPATLNVRGRDSTANLDTSIYI